MKTERSDFENMKLLYENHVLNEMAFGYGQDAVPVTQEELVEKVKLAHKLGSKPISITSVTIPKQSKKNPYYPIYKVSQLNGFLNFDYPRSVNARRELEGKEPDFIPQPRKWGKIYIDDEGKSYPGLIVNNGLYYVQIKVQHTRDPIYIATAATGLQVLDPESAKDLITPSADPGESQGLDVGVIVRDYKVENIVGVSLANKEYRVSDISEEKQRILKMVGLE